MRIIKKMSMFFLSLAIAFCFTGCGGGSSSKDDIIENSDFLSDLKDSLTERWDYTDKDGGTNITEANKIEEEKLNKYKKANFKDDEFGALAKQYIATLKKMRESYKDSDSYFDDSDYQTAYNERAKLLYTFHKKYELSFEGHEYEDIFDEMLDNGKAVVNKAEKDKKIESQKVELQNVFNDAQWQQVNAYSYDDEEKDWVTTLTNTTSFNIKSVSYEFIFYDANNVKLASEGNSGTIKDVEKGTSFQIKISEYYVPNEATSVKLKVSTNEYDSFDVE